MFEKFYATDVPAFGDAHFANPQEAQKATLLGPKGIRLGYYRVPGYRKGWGEVLRYNGDGGLITIAPARTGKFRDVLAAALLDYEQSAIVIDPKGQLASVTAAHRRRMGQQVVFLNPYNVWPQILGPSARYNPMKLLDPSSRDWAADCRKLAEGLIAPSNTDKEAHWIGGARGLLTGIIGGLVAHGAEDTQNLAHVRDIICDDGLLLRYARAAKNSPHAFIRQELASYALKEPYNAGEISSFKQNARVQTSFIGLETMAENLRGDDFRFAPLKETPTTVYIILPDNMLDVCGPWFRVVVASALDDLWRGGKGKYRVLAILDEMAAIGHLDLLAKAAATAAGRGIQLWPIYQDIPQIKKDYGEGWETFLSGSDIRIFFGGPRDPTTADIVSKQAGTRTVITSGQSVRNAGPFGTNDESDNEGQTGQPLIRPHEVSGLGENESLIFGPRNIVVNALRRPYFHTPELVGLYDPDPMHTNDAKSPPPVEPETIITFADALAASEQRSQRARQARRPFARRVLTWGSSQNRVVNLLRKIEYIATLSFRLPLAIIAAPFALSNRPLGALIGFLALFGFWEVWNDFAKDPIVSQYRMKSINYQWEALRTNPKGAGDIINSNYRAAKWVIGNVGRWIINEALGRSGDSTEARPSNQPQQLQKEQLGRVAGGNRLDATVANLSGAFDQGRRETLDQAMHSLDSGVNSALDRAVSDEDDRYEKQTREWADKMRRWGEQPPATPSPKPASGFDDATAKASAAPSKGRP